MGFGSVVGGWGGGGGLMGDAGRLGVGREREREKE